MLRLVARLSSRLRAYDPVAILDEFAALLRAETDFTTEADNLEAVRRTFAANDAVTIPRVLTDMSDESVLVMEWIDGIPVSNREALEAAGVNRAGLARAILQAYGVMIFQSDRFHADPHPGNLIALDGARLGLVDFGEVGSVEPAERSTLLNWLMTAVLWPMTAKPSQPRSSRSVEPHELSIAPSLVRDLGSWSTPLSMQVCGT